MLSEPFFLSLQLAGECDSYRGLGSGGSAVLVRRDHANHGRGKPTNTTQAKSRIPFFARAKVCTLRFFFFSFFFSFFFPFLFLLFLIYFLSMATCLDQQIQWSLEAEYCTRRVRNTSPWLTTFITKFALSHQVPVQITQNIKRKIDKHFRRAEASPSFFTAAVAPAFWKHGGIDPGHTPSCWMKNRPSLCQSEWAQSRTRHFVPFWKPKG